MNILPRKITLWVKFSLVPKPPPFLPSIFIHNNTRGQKTSKKRGRPGSIHHVSGREVDVGGERPIFKCIRTKPESELYTYLPVKMSSFYHAKVWSPKIW